MAKNMAKVENSIVVNILWCSDREIQTDSLIDIIDRPVGVGDIYDGENFYRDGEKILTPLETAQQTIAEYETAFSEIENALNTNS